MTPAARVTLERSAEGVVVRFAGPVVLDEVDRLLADLRDLPESAPVIADLSEATALDTAGAWLVATALARKDGGRVVNASPAQTTLLEAVAQALPSAQPVRRARPRGILLERIGRTTIAGLRGLIEITGFLGLVVARLGRTLVRPWRLRLTALVFHIQQAGLNAAPIVALTGFLIGVVLAYQGADQLREFGAEIFVVDLIAISILRELGILLTAIIVAGRSASAFTAAVGSMKIGEEVDAMRTLGLDPVELLVLPRVLALVIFLPLLGILADLTGLLGGAAMAWFELGISPGVFLTRLLDTDVSHFVIGLAKAPFFAVLIGVIGCFQGLKVEGNADSLGRLTSRSVVQAIFMVLAVDGVFSMFFAALGL